ncbi:C39 family peptidase [Candidatus Woesearchaeota archaeon]|nr:C39 family peptidase [Candidatus Woesearchaeota archaeon]
MKQILEVTRIKQEKEEYSGIAALCMVLNFYGTKTDQEDLASNFLLNGAYDKELLKSATSQGFFAYSHKNASLDTIVSLLKQGIPAIAKTKGSSKKPLYCVITGYDLDTKEVYFNDPSDLRRTKLNFENFQKTWTLEDNKRGYKNFLVSVKPKKKK